MSKKEFQSLILITTWRTGNEKCKTHYIKLMDDFKTDKIFKLGCIDKTLETGVVGTFNRNYHDKL